jgi:error-prone DNA polymerase
MSVERYTLEKWRESGRWWINESGTEFHTFVDEEGVLRTKKTRLPAISMKSTQTEYIETQTEDWDLRVRKQRDMKVAKACGFLADFPGPSKNKKCASPYVPLHVLSGYAFGSSTLLAEEIPILAAACGLPAVAVADPFNLAGAVEFSTAAKKVGIKPLIGTSIEMAEGGCIVLIAKSAIGYRNLSCLITQCHLNEPRLFPLCNWERLRHFSEELICLTGGHCGIINLHFLRKRYADGATVLHKLIDIFGRNNVFVEIERCYVPWEISINRKLVDLANAEGVRTVAGGQVTHARPDHFPAQDILVCAQSLCTVEEIVGRKPHRAPEQPSCERIPERAINCERYLRTPQEMLGLFHDLPDLLDNTLAIADECDDSVLPPRTSLPPMFADDRSALREAVYAGANERYVRISGKLNKRIERELERISRLGFATHFLVAWDFCNWARERGILFSGRGSVVDSVVAYCLGMSRIDAYRHNLHFDRFLPDDGSKRPDIDIDFPAKHRNSVREYVKNRYGEDHVATVAAIGSYCTRGIVRAVGKALELPDQLIGFLCERLHGSVMPDKLEDAMLRKPELRGCEFLKERLRWVFLLAGRLMDVPQGFRAHSSGIVISREPISHTVPVMESAIDGVRIIQFDKRSAKHFFDKFDVLCLRGQDVLEGTQNAIRMTDSQFDVQQIPLDDPETYRAMRSGQLIGIPQSASPAMRQAHIRLRTENLVDASLVQAGIRPGVGGAVKINELIARRRGKPYSFSHPELERILGKTYGIIVFQEQVDQLLQTFAKYTSGEAEDIRDSIHKKRRENFAKQIREEIVGRIIDNGYGVSIAIEVYDLVSGFQGYGFAEGHALAFAEISVRSIYCQQKHTSEYFTALLNAQPAGYYESSTLVNEARIRGVDILYPDVNASEVDFVVEGISESGVSVPNGGIRVGLKAISELSAPTQQKIVETRKGMPYQSVFDFARRVNPNREELANLVLCGALDSLYQNRRALMWSLPSIVDYAKSSVYDHRSPPLPFPEVEPKIEFVGSDYSQLMRAVHERAILGLDVERHLFHFERERVSSKGALSAHDANIARHGERFYVVGIPIRLRFPPTESGRRVLFFDLEDETGLLNVTCFDDTYRKDGHTIVTSPYVTVFGEAQDRDGHTGVLAIRVFPYRPVIESELRAQAQLAIADFLVK